MIIVETSPTIAGSLFTLDTREQAQELIAATEANGETARIIVESPTLTASVILLYNALTNETLMPDTCATFEGALMNAARIAGESGNGVCRAIVIEYVAGVEVRRATMIRTRFGWQPV